MRGEVKIVPRFHLTVDSIFGGAVPVEESEEAAGGAVLAGPVQEVEKAEPATWVAIHMTDGAGDPVKDMKYKIELPDGSTREGALDRNGLARVESPKAGECKITFPDLDAGDWEPTRAGATAVTTAAPKEAAKRKYFGTLKGPSGPLKSWPFLLQLGGQPMDQALDGGSSPNEYRDGHWLSGANGEFRFEDLPEGDYGIEVLMPRGDLVASDKPKPSGVDESGHRSPLPEPIDPMAFTEDPDEIVSNVE